MRLEPPLCYRENYSPLCGRSHAKRLPQGREVYPMEWLGEGGSRPPFPLSHLGFSSYEAHLQRVEWV